MSVTAVAPNPVAKFRNELMAMTPELANALPSHIKPEKFQRVVLTVVQLQPELLGCDRRSLFAACLKCAADGLIPDGREAALVKFGNAVTYMPMFTGIQKRVRNSGEITSIQAHVVYENDDFVWQQGVEASVVHKPKFPGDRGKPIGVYAIAKFKDGSDPQIEVMDWNAVERIRKVSRSAGNGPWVQWPEEMARKSCFRRLAKWLPLDAEADTLMRRDDEGGAPTVESPGGVLLEGHSEELDGFEAASRGVHSEATEEETAHDPDRPDVAQVAALRQQFNDCQTAAEVHALANNPAVKRRMAEWKKGRPELFKSVDDAVSMRLLDLEPVGNASENAAA